MLSGCLCHQPFNAKKALSNAYSLSYLQGVINKKQDKPSRGGNKDAIVRRAGFQSKFS